MVGKSTTRAVTTQKSVKPRAARRATRRATIRAKTRTVKVKTTKRKKAGPVRAMFVRRNACRGG